MKICLYDKDLHSAARLAMIIKHTVKDVSIEYCEQIDDPHMADCAMVIADPAPLPTKEWLDKFVDINQDVPLVLVSANKDLISGSNGDACYALTKPYEPKDLLEVIKVIVLGPMFGLKGLDHGRKSN